MKHTTKSIINKKGAEKLVMITAYDAIFARLADKAGADLILVGDSLGNTFLGFDNTVPVTIDMMVHHTAAVSRAKTNALVVADMPFASAHHSFDRLLDDAKRLVQEGGAQALKIEGGAIIADKVKRLVDAGIAVMAHIGLEPQQVLRLGGYKKFGANDAERAKILADAKALEEAGAFSILLEMTDADTAKLVTESVSVPTIGIGAGSACDGQVLVCADILGLSEKVPPFVKQYAKLGETIEAAYRSYADEVRSGKFPQGK